MSACAQDPRSKQRTWRRFRTEHRRCASVSSIPPRRTNGFRAFLQRDRPVHPVRPPLAMPRNDGYAIDERAFKFCCDVVAFASTIPAGPKANQLIDRLVSAAGSIGGSPDEAPAGPTDSAPARDVDIVLRAANESERWLRACAVRNLGA